MKMSPEKLQAIEVAASMQSMQSYDRGTVLSLLSHIHTIETEKRIAREDEEQVTAKYGEALRAVDRLTENVVQLQRELTESREGKKVRLPKEVAEAITIFKKSLTDSSIVYGCFQVPQLTSKGQIIRDFAADNFHTFLTAIVNDYTVEEPLIDKEQRLRLDIRSTFEGWKRGRHIDIVKAVDGVLDNYFKADN